MLKAENQQRWFIQHLVNKYVIEINFLCCTTVSLFLFRSTVIRHYQNFALLAFCRVRLAEKQQFKTEPIDSQASRFPRFLSLR